jgi:hypothetical protein
MIAQSSILEGLMHFIHSCGSLKNEVGLVAIPVARRDIQVLNPGGESLFTNFPGITESQV